MSRTCIAANVRRIVIERAHECCEYCRIAQDDQFFTFQIDHIIAEKHGGATEIDNLSLACAEWNVYKGSDIASVDWEDDARIVGLFHPRRQQWDDHFFVEEDTGFLKALTATGRVTIALLMLNTHERMTDRLLLIAAGRYPCSD